MQGFVVRDPKFTRREVADILGVSPLTIANREKRGQYPPPRRDLNNYREYSLREVFNLQILSFGYIDRRPIVSILFDKGFKDQKELGKLLDATEAQQKGVAL